MKTTLTVITLLSGLVSFGPLSLAKEAEGISKVELEQINAECKEESRGAENPEWYAGECVDERVHALKVERGLEQPKKEEG